MDQANLLKEITENLPAFFCAAEVGSGRVLMLNQAAADIFGDIKTIDEAAEENALQATAGDRIDGRFEYNAKIGSRWYWISNFPVTWEEGQKAEVFFGVEYGMLKNFGDLTDEEIFSDDMKGPANAFDRLEKQVIEYKKGTCDTFTVCYLDIDGVKMINDKLGETGGDAYIQTVIKVVKSSIRKSDLFIHIGGDDFMLIFPKCTYAVIDNIMDAVVKKLDVINIDNEMEYEYSVSYGILEVNSDSRADVDFIMSTIKQRMKDMKDLKAQNRQEFYFIPPETFTSSSAI